MIEHPYQHLRNLTHISRRLSSASTVACDSTNPLPLARDKNSFPTGYSPLHQKVPSPLEPEHKALSADGHWLYYYLIPPHHPSTRRHPSDSAYPTSTSAEAIALHSCPQDHCQSVQQRPADALHHECSSAPLAPSCLGIRPQTYAPSALPPPSDSSYRLLTFAEATPLGWRTPKGAREASGIRRSRGDTKEQSLCAGGVYFGDQFLQTTSARKPLRTRSLDRGRDAYCSTITSGDLDIPLPSHPLTLKEDPFVLDTDPQDTASVWGDVRIMSYKPGPNPSYAQQTVSSTSKHRPGNAGKPPSSTTSNSRKKGPSPYDTDFDSRVLTPRNITMAELETSLVLAHLHFGAKKPEGIRRDHYAKERKAIHTSIWLEADENFVADVVREYRCMHADNMNEAEFATWGKTHLFKNEPRALTMPEQRCWKSERMVELVAKPSEKKIGNTWHPPPLVRSPPSGTNTAWHEYAFDLRADCSYGLSLQAFSPAWMTHVSEHVHVMKKRITLPYETVEFEKDDFDDAVAENQVAAASSVAIYNRFRLKEKALRVSGGQWTAEKLEHIRHYCITMKGSTYAVWVGTPTTRGDFIWDGCELTRIFKGDLTIAEGVIDFVDWVNEIHCWALTVYGPRAEVDIKLCIDPKVSGFRVSDIAMSLQS